MKMNLTEKKHSVLEHNLKPLMCYNLGTMLFYRALLYIHL